MEETGLLHLSQLLNGDDKWPSGLFTFTVNLWQEKLAIWVF